MAIDSVSLTLMVDNVDQAIDFYVNKLGLFRTESERISDSVQNDGGQTIHSRTFALKEEGFQPWQVPLKGDGKVAALTFVVSAASQVDRFFCFTARVVP